MSFLPHFSRGGRYRFFVPEIEILESGGSFCRSGKLAVAMRRGVDGAAVLAVAVAVSVPPEVFLSHIAVSIPPPKEVAAEVPDTLAVGVVSVPLRQRRRV